MNAVATQLLGASLVTAACHAAGLPVVADQGANASAAGDRAGARPAAALLARGGTLVLPQMLLRLQFALDTPGALLLGVAALLWIAGGLYAATRLRGRPDAGRFAVWWLLTLTGSVGVFIAADLVSFYLVFSMVSLAAYGLIIDDGTPRHGEMA